MIRKLMICPYFGPFPEWMDLFLADFERTMEPQGYTLLLDTNLPAFKDRVKIKLGINCPIVRGSSKAWDYRGSLGVLYSEEIKGFDFYGHCDFDVAWGYVSKFLPDSELESLDVWSGHSEYVNGSFSLYKNKPEVNELFNQFPQWRDMLIHPEPNGWIEQMYSRALEQSGLKYAYTFHQGNPWTTFPQLKKDGLSLFQFLPDGWQEIMFYHFRHSKTWPL